MTVWAPVQVAGVGETEAARVAERQRWVIHREQLLAAGIGRGAITHRVSSGRLYARHRGVFLWGRPDPVSLAAEMAAVLYARGHGVLGGATAAYLWGWLDEPPPVVTLTVCGRDLRSSPGLNVSRARRLHRDDIARRHGLPVVSPARALVETAGRDDRLQLESSLVIARRHGLRDAKILQAIDRASHRRGVAVLRELVLSDADPADTRSRYERQLLKLVRQAGLPAPQTNVMVHGKLVDAHWAHHKLVVEFDSVRWHLTRQAFETDRLRDQHLAAAGYTVIRITYRQLDETPFEVVARLAAALALRSDRAA